MSDVLMYACWRVADWSNTSSVDLAVAVVQPAAVQPITLLPFLEAVADEGGSLAEAGKVYAYHGLLLDIKDALAAGNYADTVALFAIADAVCDIAAPSRAAIDAVIGARTLRLIDIVAAEQNEPPPETVSAADVDAALGRT